MIEALLVLWAAVMMMALALCVMAARGDRRVEQMQSAQGAPALRSVPSR